MPAEARGWAEQTGPRDYILRYRDHDGRKQRARSSTGTVLHFPSKTQALNHFRDVIAPSLRGDVPTSEHTFREFVPIFLERHGTAVRSRTIDTLRERLGHPSDVDGETDAQRRERERNAVKAFGDVKLPELARMADEIAAWQATLPARVRHGRMQALRQCLDAAVRWGHMPTNPAKQAGKNPKTPHRKIRPYTRDELARIAVELPAAYRALPEFAAATGMRPEEWLVLERGDIDRRNGVIHVRRTLSDGEVVEIAKTSKSLRQIPLNRRALAALDQIPTRLDTRLLFPAIRGGVLNLNNFRKREWSPAVDLAGVARPARIYDLRATYASEAISAGIGSDALARVMGTSVAMIEEHYGILLDAATAKIAEIQDAYELERQAADETEASS